MEESTTKGKKADHAAPADLLRTVPPVRAAGLKLTPNQLEQVINDRVEGLVREGSGLPTNGSIKLTAAQIEDILKGKGVGGIKQEPPYRYTNEYAEYKAFVQENIDKIFAELNGISKAMFGTEMVKPKVVFDYSMGMPAYAQYIPDGPQANTIVVYDDPTFQAYKMLKSSPSGANTGIDDVPRVIGHELGHALGHALIIQSYYPNIKGLSPLLKDPERLLQIEEGAADVIGFYVSNKVAGLQTDNKTIARHIAEFVAEVSSKNSDAIDQYVSQAEQLRKRYGYNPGLVKKFAEVISGMDENSTVSDTKYLYPELAMVKALMNANGMKMEVFMKQLFEDPHAFPDVKEMMDSKDYTDEIVKRYVALKQSEINYIREAYKKLREDQTKDSGPFDPTATMQSPAQELVLSTEYKSTMDLAKRLSKEFNDLELKAGEVLRQSKLPDGQAPSQSQGGARDETVAPKPKPKPKPRPKSGGGGKKKDGPSEDQNPAF